MMKKRTISAAVILLVTMFSLFFSKHTFGILLSVCGVLGLREFIHVKFPKKRLEFINFISYILVLLMITNEWIFSFDMFHLVIVSVILFLIPIIFYNDQEKYSILDAFYMIGVTFLLGISLNSLLVFRIENIYLSLLVFIVCYITDTYAYLSGSLVGKHSLTSISPKKTWEGSIIASLVGTFIITLYIDAFLTSQNIFVIVVISFILTLICQFGDLIFSSIKRYFKIKDFSNLIPGHGGMLDRLDSIIFVSLILRIFISVL